MQLSNSLRTSVNFDEKLEQNEDLAKLRAGVSLAKTGIQDAKIMIDD